MPAENGVLIPLEKAIILVGRNPDCDIQLTHSRKVSRKHCCIAQVNDRYVIRDLGSTNGVAVNGRRIRKEVAIEFGDEIMIGDVQYVLREQAAREPASRAPVLNSREERPPAKAPVRTPIPPAISQDIPVAIPEHDFHMASPDSRRTPDVEIPAAAYDLGQDSDGDDSVIPLRADSDSL
jgi:pSer/pThr/pTyr-binding forkhead associated (FHA) protein